MLINRHPSQAANIPRVIFLSTYVSKNKPAPPAHISPCTKLQKRRNSDNLFNRDLFKVLRGIPMMAQIFEYNLSCPLKGQTAIILILGSLPLLIVLMQGELSASFFVKTMLNIFEKQFYVTILLIASPNCRVCLNLRTQF